MNRLLTLFLVLAFAAGATGVANADLLTNGDLDSPGPGLAISNWTKDESKTLSGPVTDLISLEPWIEIGTVTNGGGDPDLGGFFKAFQGDLGGGDLATAHVYQDVPGTPGLKYILTGWFGAGANYSGLLAGATQTELAIEFDNDTDRNNGFINSAVLDVQGAGLASGGGPDFGAQQFMVMDIAPAGTTSVRARFSMIDAYNTTNPDPALFVDDFVLTAVPEPATWALVGLALVGLSGFRRRSK